MPNNLCPAKRGRFQTRLSRLVDITSSKEIQEPVPGNPGKTVPKTIWLGTLYASNGKVPEGQYEWEASGAYRNQRGVASPLDLSTYVGPYPGQAEAPLYDSAASSRTPAEQSIKMVADTAQEMISRVAEQAQTPKPFEVDERLKPHITGLVLDLYDYLLKAAKELGLDVEGRSPCIRGPWIEAVNDTLVGVMDSPKAEQTEQQTKE